MRSVTKETRAAYSAARRAAVSAQKKLIKEGLGTKAARSAYFPTLKELDRSGKSISAAMKKATTYTTRQDISTVRAAAERSKELHRQAQARYSAKSDAQQEARKRYRERMAALTTKEKGLIKTINTLKQKGFIDKNKRFGPLEVKQFSEYLQYRNAQGREADIYVIDTWAEDFMIMNERHYTQEQLIRDIEAFKAQRVELVTRGAAVSKDAQAYSYGKIQSMFTSLTRGETPKKKTKRGAKS